MGVRGQGPPTDWPHRATDKDLLSCWTDWKGWGLESSLAQLEKFVFAVKFPIKNNLLTYPTDDDACRRFIKRVFGCLTFISAAQTHFYGCECVYVCARAQVCES